MQFDSAGCGSPVGAWILHGLSVVLPEKSGLGFGREFSSQLGGKFRWCSGSALARTFFIGK